jgi:hypothetical protein
MRVSYFLTATGLDSVDGAPLAGVLLAGTASFDVAPDQLPVLPELRRWVRDHGGTIATESGSPAPAETVEDSDLYIVSLGARPVSTDFVGYRRRSRVCDRCGLPMILVDAEPVATSKSPVPGARLAATSRAAWLGDDSILGSLQERGLDTGLSTNTVRMRGGSRAGLWPNRILASHEASAGSGAHLCRICLRLVTERHPASEWIPRYSMGLYVQRPEDTTGWWWHARLGQHLPIVSGRVIRVLQSNQPETSAIPVILEREHALLPKELRDE